MKIKKKDSWNAKRQQKSKEKPQPTSGPIFIKNLTPVWSFLCLFTVGMKFIPICNLQTFLWAPGLERAPGVWMGWDGGGGGGDERKGRR